MNKRDRQSGCAAHKASQVWEKIQALMNWLDEMNDAQREFILNCFNHVNPYTPREELTEDQIRWIDWLYAKHELGEENAEW